MSPKTVSESWKNIAIKNFAHLLLLNAVLLFVMRLLETILVVSNFGSQAGLFGGELLGFCSDFVTGTSILICLYPLHWIAFKRFPKATRAIFLSGIILFSLLHLSILFYFLYQLAPLDTFFYHYPLEEQFFVVRSMGYNWLHIGGGILFVSLLVLAIFRGIKKLNMGDQLAKRLLLIAFVLLPLKILLFIFGSENASKFELNKSFFFYSRSLSYYWEKQQETTEYSKQDALAYKSIFGNEGYRNESYPLLHDFDTTDVLGPLFNRFDKAPNVVILIVEGLNDDFIHPYKGIELMPFLSSLQKKSLYWDHCFTLGERSFAAVPCLTGSLPYAESGFTMQEQIPRHLSLFSILEGNNYQSAYFYGQGSWFHNMNLYLNYQHTDLTVDNNCFSPKYKKILVGKEQFFWGYHDKDLFNQSLDVVDTITATNRFHVYFTGSMHSPFQISESRKYEQNLLDAAKKHSKPSDQKQFEQLKRFYSTIPFTDDALKSFFEQYSKRPEFENTIFIITGDHPMTEVPRENLLKRYHVPLIIYTPKLKNPKTYSSVCSHLDVYESLLSLLKTYGVKVPDQTTALGAKLPVDSKSRKGKFAFMNDNRELIDFYEDGFFISGKQLFRVDEHFKLQELQNEKRFKQLHEHLEIFQKTVRSVSNSNRILPKNLFCKYLFYDVIYAYEKRKSNFSGEFHDLFKKVKLPKSNSYLSVSFDYTCDQPKEFSFVFEITDERDSSLLWAGTPLKNNRSTFQERFPLNLPQFKGKNLYLKAYFWNGKKQRVELKNTDLLVYQRRIK